MQRVIIFEGADMVGKTEIAKALSLSLGIPYFKNENETKKFLDPKDYFVNTLKYADPYFVSFLKQTKTSVIIDRHYPSEWVYSKVFGRPTDMEALQRTDTAFAEAGAIIVFCWREKHLRKDDAFPGVIDTKKLSEIQDNYKQFCNWTKCRVIPLNVDDEDIERELLDLHAMLEVTSNIEMTFGSSKAVHEFFDESNDNEFDVDDEPEVSDSDIETPVATTDHLPDPDKDWSDVDWSNEK